MKAQLSCHQSLTCWINSHNASLDFCHDETVDIWFIILNKFTIFIWILFYHDVQMSPAATFMTTNSIWMMTISLRPCTKEYPTTHLIYVFTWQNIFLFFNGHPNTHLWVHRMDTRDCLYWKLPWYCVWSVCQAKYGQKICHQNCGISPSLPVFTQKSCPWCHFRFVKNEKLECEIKVSLG